MTRVCLWQAGLSQPSWQAIHQDRTVWLPLGFGCRSQLTRSNCHTDLNGNLWKWIPLAPTWHLVVESSQSWLPPHLALMGFSTLQSGSFSSHVTWLHSGLFCLSVRFVRCSFCFIVPYSLLLGPWLKAYNTVFVPEPGMWTARRMLLSWSAVWDICKPAYFTAISTEGSTSQRYLDWDIHS